MSDEPTTQETTDEALTLTRSEERAAVAAQAAADKADAAAAAAEAGRLAIALIYDPTKPGANGVPRRDLTVQEAEVYLATREAVAGLCAYGAYRPTDALPAALRPEAKKE